MSFACVICTGLFGPATGAEEHSPTLLTVRLLNGKHLATPQRPLRVEIRGTAHASATFDVVGWVGGVPMREVAPGRYQGIYRLSASTPVGTAAVIGHLTVDGHRASLQANRPAGLARTDYIHHWPVFPERPSRVYFVDVTGPLPGYAIQDHLMVGGHTVGCPIIRVVARSKSCCVEATASTDQTGDFTVPVNLGRRLPAGEILNVHVVAQDRLDPYSAASEEVEFDVVGATANNK